jgi:EpsI family protein
VLLAVTIAVAYLSNGARIALIGLMALRGVGNNDRRLHLLEGLATSIVGFVPLLACVSLLSKTEPTSQPRDDSATSSAADERGRRRMRSLAIEYGVLAVVVSAGVVVLFFRPVDVRLTAELRSFPEHIEDWSMAPSEAPFAVPLPAIDDDLLPTAYPSRSGARRFTSVDIDDELVRTYQNASGERVRLYVGYDRYQQDGKALDGEASGLLHAAARPLRLGNADSTAIEINQVVWPQSGDGMFFWYDFNGRIVTNRYAAKAYMLWDAVTRFRTNGAVIMVAWSRPRTADLDSSRRCAMGFVRALLPVLTRYLPT